MNGIIISQISDRLIDRDYDGTIDDRRISTYTYIYGADGYEVSFV